MTDQLAGLRARGREGHPKDDVVEPQLEHPEQVLARRPGLAARRVEVILELSLENRVHPADLLLLAQLEAEVADLAAADAMLTGRSRSALERALLRVTAAAFQEELRALPAAETTNRC